MINGHNQRKLLANFLKFSFLIRRIWTCTPGSVVLLPPSANIHLPCVARWLGSRSEDGACAPEAGYQQPYQTNFTALSHCDPVVGCSVTIASSDQRKKRAKARPVRTLRHPPHRQPVKDTLLWSGETLNPSNTQNNLWIRMVKSVFRNSTDGLSIYIYAAWLQRAVYVFLALKATSIRRPVQFILLFPQTHSPQWSLKAGAWRGWVIQTSLLREGPETFHRCTLKCLLE